MASSFGARVCCPHHPGAHLIEDYRAGDMICSKCGLVVGDRIVDVGSEWRTFQNDRQSNDPTRVGAAVNPLLNGADLSTVISQGTGAASFDESGKAKYANRRALSSSDRALLSAFQEIRSMNDRLNSTQNVAERAKALFKQLYDGKYVKGRSSEAIGAACVYIACRMENVPRTFKEICAVSKVSKKDIGRCFKLATRALETSVAVITTGDFMSRFCARLGLNNAVQKAATQIARKAGELDLVCGKSPISVTAAAIYMASQASGTKMSPKQIGDIAGVAETTIRQTYKLMYPKAAQLFPEDFKFHTSIAMLPVN